VRLRNIFDPQRNGANEATGEPAPPPQAAATPPPKASDFVALTGVMVTADKTLAFFSGSRPDYDRVLSVNAGIAGAKVTKITTGGIEVSRNGRTIVVAVGQTVPFDNSAPAAAPVTVAGNGDSGSASDSSSEAPSSSSSNGNLDAIMRRMMERRQQQLK